MFGKGFDAGQVGQVTLHSFRPMSLAGQVVCDLMEQGLVPAGENYRRLHLTQPVYNCPADAAPTAGHDRYRTGKSKELVAIHGLPLSC